MHRLPSTLENSDENRQQGNRNKGGKYDREVAKTTVDQAI